MLKGWRPSYIPDFGVSAPPGGDGGGPGGRRDKQHDAPQHVGHQGQKEVRQLEVLQLVQIPIPAQLGQCHPIKQPFVTITHNPGSLRQDTQTWGKEEYLSCC